MTSAPGAPASSEPLPEEVVSTNAVTAEAIARQNQTVVCVSRTTVAPSVRKMPRVAYSRDFVSWNLCPLLIIGRRVPIPIGKESAIVCRLKVLTRNAK
jgi:hypothetical protein